MILGLWVIEFVKESGIARGCEEIRHLEKGSFYQSFWVTLFRGPAQCRAIHSSNTSAEKITAWFGRFLIKVMNSVESEN